MTDSPIPQRSNPHGVGDDARRPISIAALLVVEGRDMAAFFHPLLEKLGLDEAIDVRNAGDKDNFGPFLRTLVEASGFHIVRRLGLVRDADDDPAKAFTRMQAALRFARLPAPDKPLQFSRKRPSAIVTILPGPTERGMLETLCYRSVETQPVIPCIDPFLACVQQAAGKKLKHLEKSKLHAYIAAQDDPFFKVGEAAKAGYFLWDSTVFDQVKLFLRQLGSTAS